MLRQVLTILGVCLFMLAMTGTVAIPADAAMVGSDGPSAAMEQPTPISVPEPGQSADQESTVKHRDPAKTHHRDQNATVTLGGAKYVVEGEILDIDGSRYFIKDDETGEEVAVIVNRDSRVICPPSPGGGVVSKQDAEDRGQTEQQKSQGQRQDETAIGGGYHIGATANCNFAKGDHVKAEISDVGTVTTVRVLTPHPSSSAGSRSLGASNQTGELAMSEAGPDMPKQDKPGQLDMSGPQGKSYAILPIPLGKFEVVTSHPLLLATVMDQNGGTIGIVQSLIQDSTTGNIEYAEVDVNGIDLNIVVPWAYFSPNHTQGTVRLNTRQYQLIPSYTKLDTLDASPSARSVLKDMDAAKAPIGLLPREDRKAALEQQKAAPPAKWARDLKGTLVRGEVIDVDYDRNDKGRVVVRDDGNVSKEISIVLDKETLFGMVNFRDDEIFKVGDEVEAFVSPEGHAEAISLMRYQGGMPNETEAGG